jgi:hypothetical protein
VRSVEADFSAALVQLRVPTFDSAWRHPVVPGVDLKHVAVLNLACCESQSGRTIEALDHLRQAIEMSEEFRRSAREDSDLDPLRSEPAFQQLLTD